MTPDHRSTVLPTLATVAILHSKLSWHNTALTLAVFVVVAAATTSLDVTLWLVCAKTLTGTLTCKPTVLQHVEHAAQAPRQAALATTLLPTVPSTPTFAATASTTA